MAKKITLIDVKENMILAEPIVNKFGNILIPAGTSLKLSHLQLLKIWNIKSIMIIDMEDEDFNNISNEQKEIARKILNKKIQWQARNEWEEDLLELGVLSIAMSLNHKQANIDI